MSSTGALLFAAAGLGFAHSVLPDHWLPLATLARQRKDPLRRVAALSGLAALAHLAVTLICGAACLIVGLSLRSSLEHDSDLVVGAVLIITGVCYLIGDRTGRSHAAAHRRGTAHQHPHPHPAGDHDHDHDHGHGHGHGRLDEHERCAGHSHPHAAQSTEAHEHTPHDHEHAKQAAPTALRRRASLLIPFGAAASPDLSILPVILASTTLGARTAAAAFTLFAAATIATFITLSCAATISSRHIRSTWIDAHANQATAAVLIGIGVAVSTHLL